MYDEIKNFMFSEIGNRIKSKKEEYEFTNYELAGYRNKADYEGRQKDSETDNKEDRQLRYDKFDLSIITNIVNGKFYPAKNPNLMSDSILSRLTQKLKFTSELSLLWGDFENSNFPQVLFEKVVFDILYSGSEKQKAIINGTLIDYVPYAEYHSYWQMFIVGEVEMPKFPDSEFTISSRFYQITVDEIFEQYEPTQKNAIKYFFYKHNESLSCMIRGFLRDEFRTDDGYSLKKIDKKINLLLSRFMDYFEKNIPNDDSLGLRVRSIIISDYKKFGTLIAKDLSGNQDQLELPEITQKLLIESSLAYITTLKRVQKIESEVINGDKF
ncbi:TPA: hypothetical protein IQB69_002149 [Listeria monocytogenes]|nr:hypothetical protein [Listeria monocytogenes]EHC6224157.1 hypothetical protein [Listeria monocytogenes serotype 1/2a]EAG0263306.1 hypothetical protein [Listeria monocytogenes]EHN2739988.1 hypothetical protein [Listeria monocytogenes]EIV1154301.1 hypothetical protein [Listeria monocytogenes]